MAMTEQEALAIINGFKADLSRLGHMISGALDDGKIEGSETVGLILMSTQMGSNYYYQFARLKDNIDTFLDVLDHSSFSLGGGA